MSLLAWSTGCDLSATDERDFGTYPIKAWVHQFNGCTLSVNVDARGNVKSNRSCKATEDASSTEGRMSQNSFSAFQSQWTDSLGVNRPDVRQGRCAGNAHHFINSSEGVSAGLFWVCGAGGELLDGRGLPDDLQTLIAQMLNAARL